MSLITRTLLKCPITSCEYIDGKILIGIINYIILFQLFWLFSFCSNHFRTIKNYISNQNFFLFMQFLFVNHRLYRASSQVFLIVSQYSLSC